jgi:hypothetical protein
MKKVLTTLVMGSLFVFTGCATTGMNSGTGFAAFTFNKEAVTATNHPGGNKTGEACSMNIIGIYAGGDSSIDAAKKSANINTVSSVDHEITNILGIYGKLCTVVKGN